MATKAVTRYRTRFVSRGRTRTRAKLTIPMAIVAGFIPPLVGAWNRRGNLADMASYIQSSFTGFDSTGKFNAANLRAGLIPVLGGFVIHKVAARLGINRAMARAGIPVIRI